jgi:DNA replication protein DnaC
MEKKRELSPAGESIVIPPSRGNPPPPKCAECNDTGWVKVMVPDIAPREEATIPTRTEVQRCKCAQRRIRNYKLSQIPERFRDKGLFDYRPESRDQAEALAVLQRNPLESYYIFGSYSNGKTHLAAGLYREWITRNLKAEFRTVHDLLQELTDSVVHGKVSIVEDAVQYLPRFCLVLDDLDKFKYTDYRAEILFWLIDHIYGRKLTLVVTSNYSLTELAQRDLVHPAVIRRLDDHCKVLKV